MAFEKESGGLSADLVVSQYNTAAIRSSLLGIPTLFALLPSVQKYLEARGLDKPYFPQLNPRHPIALAAFNARELKHNLETLLSYSENAVKLFAYNQKYFTSLTDDRATERVVKFVLQQYG